MWEHRKELAELANLKKNEGETKNFKKIVEQMFR